MSLADSTRYAYDQVNRPITVTYESDGGVVRFAYNGVGKTIAMTDSVGVTIYGYDDLHRLTNVSDPFNQSVEYSYDAVGNRTHLIYPDGKAVTYTYSSNNWLTQVDDWLGGTTTYQHDEAGRIMKTTLPSAVVSVNNYDLAGRLIHLYHATAEDELLASYAYELDNVGNRHAVTETLLAPAVVNEIDAFLEANGLLVLEAESGAAAPGVDGHTWVSQTVQAGYGGAGYYRALPDVGQQYEAGEADESARFSFPIYVENANDYTIWVRGMTSDAAGDSLHVGVNGQPVDTGTRLTGFDREWSWSRLTMSDTLATLPLSDSTSYTLDLWMREDGLRVDRVLLVTGGVSLVTQIPPNQEHGSISTPMMALLCSR